LGSSDALVDGTAGNVGALIYQSSFGAFGERRLSTWQAGSLSTADWANIAKTTRHGFTFHEELDNISLAHMGGRVYDPNVGRFLSVDPIVGNLADSQSLNPYAYVGNRPLSAVDPTGNIAEVVVTASAANPVVGAVAAAVEIIGDIFGLFGFDAPPPPPPANALPGQSAQSPSTPCGAGASSEACGFSFDLPPDWGSPAPTWLEGAPNLPGASPGSIMSLEGQSAEAAAQTAQTFSSRAVARFMALTRDLYSYFNTTQGAAHAQPRPAAKAEEPLGDTIGYLVRGMIDPSTSPNLGKSECGVTMNCLTFPLWGTPAGAEAAAVGAAKSAANALRLEKQLASEAQVGELLGGGGRSIAGAGTRKAIDDLPRLLSQYGGKAEDWAKVSSSSFRTRAGQLIEAHGYRNVRTGETIELKTKLP